MLSHVELNERLRTLNFAQRSLYSVLLAMILFGTFLLTTALGISVMIVLVEANARVPVFRLFTPYYFILWGLPVLLAFLLTNVLVRLTTRERITAGQTVSWVALAALRGGLVRGFVVGAIFGAFWGMLNMLTTSEVVLHTVFFGLSTSLAFGLFAALTSVAKPICLGLVTAGR